MFTSRIDLQGSCQTENGFLHHGRMTSKAHGIQTNAPVSNSRWLFVGWLVEELGNTVAHSVPEVTFARLLAGFFAVIAGIRQVILLLRTHFERWSGDDLGLLETFRKRPTHEVEMMAGS